MIADPRDPTKAPPLLMLLIALISIPAAFSQILYLSPSIPSENDYVYTKNASDVELPFDLEDLKIDSHPYHYKYSKISINLSDVEHGIYVDSMIDKIENPSIVLTLSYETWKGDDKLSLRKIENNLKDRYEGEIKEVEFDYGTIEAYWIGDCLLLIYNNYIIFFNENTTKIVIDNNNCAEYLKKTYSVEAY